MEAPNLSPVLFRGWPRSSPVFGRTGDREITHDVEEIDPICPRWPRCPRFWEGEGAACARTGGRGAHPRSGSSSFGLDRLQREAVLRQVLAQAIGIVRRGARRARRREQDAACFGQ